MLLGERITGSRILKLLSLWVVLLSVAFGSTASAADQGYIGLDIAQVTMADLQRLNLIAPVGVVVVAIRPDGPGLKAGVMVDDVIVSYDGAQVTGYSHLVQLASAKKPGDKVIVRVLRHGMEQVFNVVLTTRPKSLDQPKDQVELKGYGLSLAILTEAVRQKNKIYTQSPGLAVVGLSPSGTGAKSGIQLNDVVFKINTIPVKDVQQFENAWSLAQKSGRPVIAVHLYRAVGKMIVLVPVS